MVFARLFFLYSSTLELKQRKKAHEYHSIENFLERWRNNCT